MKKLPVSCAVVVLLAVLAYRVDATIIALTKGTGTPGALTTMDVNCPTDYDLIPETVTLFPDKDLFAGNEILDEVFVRDNNDITLANVLDATFGGLTYDGSDLAEYNRTIDIAVLILDEAKNNIFNAVHIRDNNDLILPTTPAAMPGSLILVNKGFPEYNPIPDITILFSYKDLFAVSNILDIVYFRDNVPTSNITALFFDEDLFAVNQVINVLYISGNNIIPSATSGVVFDSLTFGNRSPVEYNPTANITALHLGESIFANIDTLYVTTNSIVIPEPAPIAVLGFGSLFLLRKRKSV